MASRNATVAEAVKTTLNEAAEEAETFGETFVAKRVYAPSDPLEETKDLTVTIWAPGDVREQAARGRSQHEIPVLVSIAKRLANAGGSPPDPATEAANEQLDDLTELAEKVADHFGPDAAGVGGALWTRTEMNIGNSDAIRERRQFFAIITFTFILHRSN